jgi:hypothetical protein
LDGVTEYKPIKSGSTAEGEFLADAVKAWEEDIAYEGAARTKMHYDICFEQGKNHWDTDDRLGDRRKNAGRPCLTIPRCNAFLNQVRNEQRQNKASIKVSPRGAMSQQIAKQRIKAAKRRGDLLRAIQYDTKATIAYQCGFDFAVGPGRGWWQVTTEYAHTKTNEQNILIKPIYDPLNVVPSRYRTDKAYSDMTHCFYGNLIKKSVFQKRFPDADESNWLSTPHGDDKWMTSEDIRVSQFYCKWAVSKTLVEIMGKGGQLIYEYEDEIPEDVREDEKYKASIRKKRKVKVPKIMWYRITKHQILEQTEIPGEYVPMVPVLGIESEIEGEYDCKGMMRDLTGLGLMYDYLSSEEAERIAYASKAQFIGAAGQVEKYKDYWEVNNELGISLLPYDPVEKGGHLAPPPREVQPKQVDMAIVNSKRETVEDMKAVTGIYDPSLGNVSGERSGRAILARQRQSDNANYHFIDNLGIAIDHTANIINPWLDIYFPAGRTARLLGEDESENIVTIGGLDEETKDEITLGDPDVDITVSMGAAYNTKREEATEAIMDLVRAVPQITPLIYDIFIGNMDFPGAQAIAERLRKTIPPNLLEQKGGEEQMAMQLQQAIQQIQKDKQIIQVMQEQLQKVMQELESKGMESQTKINVAEINAEAKLNAAVINAMSDDNRLAYQIFQNILNNQNQPPRPAQQEGIRQ